MTEGLFETERLEIQRQNLEVVMTHHQDDEFTKYLQIKNVECARIRNYGPPRIDILCRPLPNVIAPVGGIRGRKDIFEQHNRDRLDGILRSIDPGAPNRSSKMPGNGCCLSRPTTLMAHCLRPMIPGAQNDHTLVRTLLNYTRSTQRLCGELFADKFLPID